MKTTNNTVLISGGSAGIGFEIAKLLIAQGNKVIITGRNKERLDAAAQQLPGVSAIQFDVTKADDVERLTLQMNSEYPALNLLINNAGNAHLYDAAKDNNTFGKAEDEMRTNYLSVIRLTEKLLPLLSKQKEAALVNVTSIVAFAPSKRMPGYAASKAALHSYTQTLRLSLAEAGNVKTFELMPPLVNTDFSQAIGGSKGIAPSVVAETFIQGLKDDTYEIHVGNTADMYQLFRSSPADALIAMNGAR